MQDNLTNIFSEAESLDKNAQPKIIRFQRKQASSPDTFASSVKKDLIESSIIRNQPKILQPKNMFGESSVRLSVPNDLENARNYLHVPSFNPSGSAINNIHSEVKQSPEPVNQFQGNSGLQGIPTAMFQPFITNTSIFKQQSRSKNNSISSQRIFFSISQKPSQDHQTNSPGKKQSQPRIVDSSSYSSFVQKQIQNKNSFNYLAQKKRILCELENSNIKSQSISKNGSQNNSQKQVNLVSQKDQNNSIHNRNNKSNLLTNQDDPTFYGNENFVKETIKNFAFYSPGNDKLDKIIQDSCSLNLNPVANTSSTSFYIPGNKQGKNSVGGVNSCGVSSFRNFQQSQKYLEKLYQHAQIKEEKFQKLRKEQDSSLSNRQLELCSKSKDMVQQSRNNSLNKERESNAFERLHHKNSQHLFSQNTVQDSFKYRLSEIIKGNSTNISQTVQSQFFSERQQSGSPPPPLTQKNNNQLTEKDRISLDRTNHSLIDNQNQLKTGNTLSIDDTEQSQISSRLTQPAKHRVDEDFQPYSFHSNLSFENFQKINPGSPTGTSSIFGFSRENFFNPQSQEKQRLSAMSNSSQKTLETINFDKNSIFEGFVKVLGQCQLNDQAEQYQTHTPQITEESQKQNFQQEFQKENYFTLDSNKQSFAGRKEFEVKHVNFDLASKIKEHKSNSELDETHQKLQNSTFSQHFIQKQQLFPVKPIDPPDTEGKQFNFSNKSYYSAVLLNFKDENNIKNYISGSSNNQLRERDLQSYHNNLLLSNQQRDLGLTKEINQKQMSQIHQEEDQIENRKINVNYIKNNDSQKQLLLDVNQISQELLNKFQEISPIYLNGIENEAQFSKNFSSQPKNDNGSNSQISQVQQKFRQIEFTDEPNNGSEVLLQNQNQQSQSKKLQQFQQHQEQHHHQQQKQQQQQPQTTDESDQILDSYFDYYNAVQLKLL